MSSQPVKNVAVVGAGGRMGSEIVKALLSEGKHTVTAITRPDSNSSMPSGVHVVKADYNDASSLEAALKGQDALVITMNAQAPPEQSIKLVEAAAAAGVSWVMPNWYGSDYHNTSLAQDTMLGPMLQGPTKRIEELGKSKWVALACGFWYEWSLFGPPASSTGGFSLGPMMYGFDAANKTVTFFDKGETKICTSTWPNAGLAVARVFALPADELEKFKNDLVYVNSFTVSQKDMLESVKRVTKTKDEDWTIKYEPSIPRHEKAKQSVFSGGPQTDFAVALYTRIFYENGDGDFSNRGLSNETLGLPKKDLDEATADAIKYSELSF